MFHSEVTLNKKVLNELNIKNYILALIATIFGLAGLIISVILHLNGDNVIFMIVVFALLTFIGVAFLIFILVALNKAVKQGVNVKAEINENKINIIYHRANEEDQYIEMDYNGNYYYRESKNYLFVTIDQGRVLPIRKSKELVEFLNSKDIYKR